MAGELGFLTGVKRFAVARLGTLSIDGTKVRANASKRKAMSYGRMVKEEKRLAAEIKALVGRAGAVHEEEDERYGVDVRGDELPEELRRREDRLKAIVEAKARLEARQRAMDDARGRKPGQDRNPKGGRAYKRAYGEPEAKAQSNFTDPQSRIMKTSTEGFQQCYNAQLAVEGENQLIVAAEVTSNASDQGQMLPRLDEVKADYGAGPETLLADAGYCNESDLASLEERGVDGYVALGREGNKAVEVNAKAHPARARMANKLATPEGQAQYAKRKWLSEAPNGWIKQALGFRRFSSARLEPSAGRVGPGVSGVEHEADARAGGGVKKGNSAPNRRAAGPIHRHSPPSCGSMTPRGASEEAIGRFIACEPPGRPAETSYGAGS